MTKPSSRFVLVLSAICGKTQISLFGCTISFHWPSRSIFAFLCHLSKLEMTCINLFGDVRTSPRRGSMVLPFRLIRDVCDFILGLPYRGVFVVAFAVIICG